ncbi:hypothetical protein MMC10_009259 [Thelotrema lepadinum]|nr:hypothetical protein [Thelotrema lepadinum]
MQTIWPRTLQLKSSCNCQLCIPSRQVLSGRLNSPPVRRKLQLGNCLTTACYTSILGGALCFDARRKQVKREALDQAIASVKSEVVDLHEDQQKRLEAIGYGAEEDPEELVRRKAAPKDFHGHTLDLIRAFQRPGGDNNGQQLPVPASNLSTDRQPVQNGLHRFGQSGQEGHGIVPSPGSDKEGIPRIRSSDEGRMAWTLAREHAIAKSSQATSQNPREVMKQAHGIHDGLSEDSASRSNMYRLALGSSGHFLGRCSEDVWNSPETPFLPNRNRMQREAAIARLVYKLALSYLTAPEVEEGVWPKTISLGLPNGNAIKLTNSSRSELERKIDDLTHRIRVLNGLRTNLHAVSSIENLSSPSYQTFDEHDRQAEASYVAVQNDSLRDVFTQSSCPSTLFSELCSTLYCQAYAPNIHTYNLLIIRLCHAQFFTAAEHVIEALFNSGINQNEVTFAAILNCYIYASDPAGFRAYLNRMDCVSGSSVRVSFGNNEESDTLISGLCLPHKRDVHLTGTTPDSGDVIMYSEKAKRNAEVFEATILGWLDIGNLRKAMLECSSMLSSGIPPSQPIYESLLQCCVKTADLELGKMVWERVTQTSEPVRIMTYYWMLQLCVLCQDPEYFEQVLQHGLYHQVLTARLLYSEFDLSTERRKRLRFRAFAIRRLEQNVAVPGCPEPAFLRESQNLPQLPNLYLMVLTKLLILAEAKRTELGWFVDNREWILNASREARYLQSQGLFSDQRMSSIALWLSTKSKAEQTINHVAETRSDLADARETPLNDVLSEIPPLRKAQLLTIDLSMPLEKQKADVLGSYLLKLQSVKDSLTGTKLATIGNHASSNTHSRRPRTNSYSAVKHLRLRTSAKVKAHSEMASHVDLPTEHQYMKTASAKESRNRAYRESKNCLGEGERKHVGHKQGAEGAKHPKQSAEILGMKDMLQITNYVKGLTGLIRIRTTIYQRVGA